MMSELQSLYIIIIIIILLITYISNLYLEPSNKKHTRYKSRSEILYEGLEELDRYPCIIS